MSPTFLAQGGGGSNFLVPNATFFAELVGFLIILFVLWKWVLPPLQKSMEQRQQTIRTQLEESQQARERLEAAEAEYDRALADARREASRLREDAQAQRKAIVEEAAAEARARGDEILTRAQEQITVERQQAMNQLRGELGRLAVELAGRVVGESLEDDARQRRVVERFLDDIERSPETVTGQTTGEGEPVR